MRGVPNHHIDDDSLKEYFYRGEVDRNKEMLDTIMGTSYGEYTYAEIVEKLEKISHNKKDQSTRTSDSGRNTFAVQATNNPAVDEIHEKMRRRELS